MIEIFLMIGATSAIAAYARGRGGSPWFWGTVTVAGYILIQLASPVLLRSASREASPLLGMVLSWAWVGAVGLYTRFGLSAGKPEACMMWTCPNCKYLNRSYAVVCEACKQPFSNSRRNQQKDP